MAQSVRHHWLTGIGLVYIIAIGLVSGIHALHMHPDEYLVYFFTRRDLPFLWWYLGAQDTHPPLWFSSYWFWWRVMGDSEFGGRFYSALLSLITLSLVYQVGRRWFGAARYGLFAMALLGVNAFFFDHALEIRPYALIMLLATASMWTFQRWLTHRTWRTAVFYAITLAAMLYVHYFLVVLILAQAIYFLLAQRMTRRLLTQAVGAGIVAFLLWLPWFPSAINQVGNLRRVELAGGNNRGVIGAGTTTVPTSLNAVIDLANYASNGQIVLYTGLLVLGTIILWRRANFRLALVWALGAPIVSLMLNTVFAIYTPRYVIYMVVGLGIACGAGLASLSARFRWWALAIVVAVTLWALPSHLPVRTPYRDLYQQVSTQARPDDVIFFDHRDVETRFVKWQIDHYLARTLRRNRVETLDEALTHRRIWFATNEEWLTDPDVQATFAELEETHPLQTAIGNCTSAWCYLLQLLEAPPYQRPVMFGENMGFWGVDVDMIAPDVIETRLWWKVDRPPSLDYSMGLYLIDMDGNLIAQADGPIHDQYLQDDIQTSQLEPGRIYIDRRSLQLPAGIPVGEYRLMLVVYQSWDNVRLLLPDGGNQLVLGPITLSGE